MVRWLSLLILLLSVGPLYVRSVVAQHSDVAIVVGWMNHRLFYKPMLNEQGTIVESSGWHPDAVEGIQVGYWSHRETDRATTLGVAIQVLHAVKGGVIDGSYQTLDDLGTAPLTYRETFSYDYLEIPIFLRLALDEVVSARSTNRLYLLLGPDVSILLRSSRDLETSRGYHETATGLPLARAPISLILGGGYEYAIASDFRIHAIGSYETGLSNVDESSSEKSYFNSIRFMLGVGLQL